MQANDKIQKITSILIDWDEKRGHDACWFYPEIFKQIADVLEIELKNPQPEISRAEFKEGCRQFQCDKFGNKKD